MSTSVRSLLRRGWLVRAAIAGALLAALLTVQNDLTALAPAAYHPFVRLALLVVAIGLGATAVREVVNAIFRTVDRQGAVVWRNLSSWTLYALVGLMIASALNVNLSGLLVGGAIIGVIVATASQASLGNFFAGLVLMLVRPYQVGAAIRLRGPLSAGGPDFEGTVVDMGALYTTLRTAPGILEAEGDPWAGILAAKQDLGELRLLSRGDVADIALDHLVGAFVVKIAHELHIDAPPIEPE